MKKSEIVGDTLVRYEEGFTSGGGMFYRKGTLVITKEEFIACYKAWIEKETQNEAQDKSQ